MTEIKFETGGGNPDAFNLYLDGKKIGELILEIADGNLTVFHTEVDIDQENKGYAGQLLAAMVKYAEENHLKVIPMCPYVHAQFQRHPEQYADIWNNTAG